MPAPHLTWSAGVANVHRAARGTGAVPESDWRDEMTYRQTFVIEYENPADAPAVGFDMKMLGGTLIACQFNDALEEIEALRECSDPEVWIRAEEMRKQLEANRS
jgi:hypothetical protein